MGLRVCHGYVISYPFLSSAVKYGLAQALCVTFVRRIEFCCNYLQSEPIKEGLTIDDRINNCSHCSLFRTAKVNTLELLLYKKATVTMPIATITDVVVVVVVMRMFVVVMLVMCLLFEDVFNNNNN